LKGSSHGIIEVIYQHLPGGSDENHENLKWYRSCPRQYSNLTPAEYKPSALMLGR